jgi:hypothetical protein
LIHAPPVWFIRRQDFDNQRTKALPAAIIAEIHSGSVAAVLLTTGYGPASQDDSSLAYWPCVISH